MTSLIIRVKQHLVNCIVIQHRLWAFIQGSYTHQAQKYLLSERRLTVQVAANQVVAVLKVLPVHRRVALQAVKAHPVHHRVALQAVNQVVAVLKAQAVAPKAAVAVLNLAVALKAHPVHHRVVLVQ